MHGYADDKPLLIKRLHRIEGQVRGLQRMVDEDAYCIDILTQVAAVQTALEHVAVEVLDGHVRHCVADAVKGGDDGEAKLDELMAGVDADRTLVIRDYLPTGRKARTLDEALVELDTLLTVLEQR
jgi:DNA-binding FrmR family transcriptional regulator